MTRWIMNNPIPTAIIFIVLGVLATGALLIREVVIDSRCGYDALLDIAIVTDKEYNAQRFMMIPQYDPMLEQTVLRQHFIPANYSLFTTGREDSYTIDVSRVQYAAYSLGDTVYVLGRIGGNSGRVLNKWYSKTLDGKDFHNVYSWMEDATR